MEELQEADVLWPEEQLHHGPASPRHRHGPSVDDAISYNAKETAPISIPSYRASTTVTSHRSWKLEYSSHRYRGDDGNDGDDEAGFGFGGGEKGTVVPPHVVVARRLSGKMAFSVCTGQGRTLKGRDLSQVRNSILRLTGFLEG